jgi:DNA-binding NtrC family response regulator
VIPIPLPNLRERRDDIPLLVAHFLRSRSNGSSSRGRRVSSQVMEILTRYDWPGNVRELENAVERASTLCEGPVIRARDLPPAILKATEHDLSQADESCEATLPKVSDAAQETVGEQEEQESARDSVMPETVDDVKPLRIFSREQESTYMSRVIDLVGGDKEQAAILLGVSLATLYRKLTEEEKV